MGLNPNQLDPLTQTVFDNSQAGVNQTTNPVLIIGQTLAADPQPFALYACTSVAQARAFAGRGSILARAFEGYFANDQVGPILLLPYPDPTGSSAASCTITIAGTTAAAGTLALYIGAQAAPVNLASGTAAAAIAAAVVAQVTAQPDLAASATAAAGVVTLTAKNAGALGNLLNVMLNLHGLLGGEVTPPGITVAITAMSGGNGTPDTTQIAAVLGNTPARLLVHPYAGNAPMQNFAALMNASTGRWQALNPAMGQCFTAHQDAAANLETYGPTNNDPHSSVLAYELGSPTPVWEAAGMFAGAMASSLRAQPNLPVQTLALNGFTPPPASLTEANGGAFLPTTRNILEGVGLGVPRYDGGYPAISRAPTTYQVNSYGQADQSYFDTEDMFTLMRIQDMIIGAETQTFGRVLLADNGTKMAPGIPMVTPALALAFMVNLYAQMEFAGLVEDASAFVAASMAQRSLTNPSQLQLLWAPYLVVGLRDIANTIQFRKYSAAAAAIAQSSAAG